jgi:uncharacterized protein YhjY with autotransporter beta-barrel domain
MMARYDLRLQNAASFVFILLVLFAFPLSSAYALSNGCSAVNALSGLTSLSFTSNAYPASDFDVSDALTVSFTDSGSGYGGNVMSADSIGVAGYNYSNSQTYNAANATSSSPHTVTINLAAGTLASSGLRVRLTTSYGELSNVVFSCTGNIAVSSDAALSGLYLSAGTLSPSFSSGTTSYVASVANSVSSITVTPLTADSSATVTVNGSVITSGSASSAIGLSSGVATSIPVVVTAQDGTTTRSYTLTVTRAEAMPIANNATATVAANSTNNALTLSISGGTPVSVAVAAPPSHGTATASGTQIIYTPNAGYSGNDSFTYNATNSAGTSANATVSLSVTAPVLTFSPATSALPAATLNSAWTQTLTASGGSAPYTWTAIGLPAGITLDSTTGVLSGTPTATGSFTLRAIATDSNNASGTVNYTLNVSEALPIARAVAATVSANSSNNTLPLALSGGVATAVNIANAPAHGTATASGTAITYTPNPGYSGSDSFTYNATNSAGSSANATVLLTITATPLTFTPAGGSFPAATVGSAWSQTVAVSGGTSPYTYSASSLPAGITLNGASGVFSGTPTLAGNYSFQVTATDSAGSGSTVSYTLSVNEAVPVASAVMASVGAGSSDNAITLSIAGTVTSVAVIRQASHGTAIAAGTRIRYTPVSNYTGSDSFTYTATNASGTSQEASVSLNVAAATLVMVPSSGALPEGTVGKAYLQRFSASGGAAPYRWQQSGTLPQGLTFANGELQGTPTTGGSASFTLTATDANGETTKAAYSLAINNAAPVAANHSASLYAGQSVKVNLVDGATGGPFTAARLLDKPESNLGTASIQSSGTSFQLLFTAAAQASGTVALRYELSAPSGTTQPAQITLTIAARPNPTTDADVIGLISAQVQAAQNFARAQIRNFNDRLEQLHSGVNLPSSHNGLRFNMPTSRPERDTDKDLWASAWHQQQKYQDEHAQPPPSPFASSHDGERLSYWTGGYIDFGSDKDDSVRFSHTMVGITTGADYRFTPAFTAGMGMGFGRDVSDVGDSGSRDNGRSLSSAIYGSWHPDAFFIDGLLGYSSLEFDSKRYVSESDAFARGSRSGRQVFSSLTSGYAFRTVNSLISPYARLQYYRTWLDGYAESDAGAFNLAFAPQRFTQVVTTTGLRGEHSVPTTWGFVKLQSRLEYSQLINDNGSARVGYADVGNDTWSMSLYEQSKQTLALGVGIDFVLPHEITPGIAYQATLGMDEQQTRAQTIMVRVNIGF